MNNTFQSKMFPAVVAAFRISLWNGRAPPARHSMPAASAKTAATVRPPTRSFVRLCVKSTLFLPLMAQFTHFSADQKRSSTESGTSLSAGTDSDKSLA
jgi:hypothetical protein